MTRLAFTCGVLIAASTSCDRKQDSYGVKLKSQQGSPVAFHPEAALVEDLDRVIQARIRNITEEDIRKGRFGAGRLGSHYVMRIFLEKEEELHAVDRLRAAGWSTALYVVGLRHRPDGTSTEQVIGPILAGDHHLPVQADIRSIGAVGRRAIDSKSALRSTAAEIPLETRPLPASGTKCLDCHRGKKVGDPLGAVVYAFHRNTAP